MENGDFDCFPPFITPITYPFEITNNCVPEICGVFRLAAAGAPFRVKERRTGQRYLAQLKPFEEAKRGLETHNVLEHPNAAQYHQVIHDKDLAIVVYEDITGTILENLLHPGVAVAEPTGMEREKMVQIFIRHLLLALEQMHGLRIAHLDLRPETILMQDGKLKLADFGQSRRLLRGLITGTIRSNPEFVSPEVVRGYPLTLATDLWSVGALAYVLLTGISPFHGDNDNETMANVDKAKVDFNGPEWSSFSEDSKHFVSQLLREIPAERMTCGEALDHRWLNEGDVKDAQLPADGLREFNYKFKWLERRVFVQQTPSEQLLEAILAPSTAVAAQQPKPPAEGAGALELYDYLRIKPRSPAPVEELAPRRKQPSGPVVPEGFSDFPADYLPPGSLPPPPEYHPRDPRRRPDTSPDRFGPQGQPSGKKEKIPLDQFGRLVRAEDLARIPHDSFGRPLDLDQQFPREDPRGNLGPIQQIPPFRGQKEGEKKGERPPPPEYSMSPEKRKLIPQEKGETPSKTRKEPRREGEEREEDAPKVPTRMIRGERRQIEEEIANRILSDISEEGSVAGSLASIDDLEPMLYEQQRRRHSPSATPHAESEVSTPTASPVNTIKEGNFFPKDADPSQYPKIDTESVQHLPRHERELLERAENDPNIPIGAPLFLEGLTNTTLQIETAPLPSPALSPKSPRRSAPGTKSPVLLSPGREHTMEALIAMKRGKPQFLKPGETAPEIDDEDAHMDKRKQKAKPQTHDSGFKDLQEELDKKRKTDLDDLEKYRPRNFYKDDVDFQRPGYDIDDSPWDSHYQIGPDTYLMAAQGPSFNSRVRDYRRTLWGEGAPLVRQGFLGYRNQDITVRERRRYTDIMREMMNGLQPKQTADSNSVMRAPSATAVDRILADIKNVAPSATKKNADGTYAPIFVSRLRDAYLGHASAIFEASVAGSPQPKIQWNFQGKPLESDDRRRIEQIGNIFRLTIQNPTAFDLGEYSCLATNEFGTDKTTSRLVSGEAPSRPGRPDCELSSDTEIFITWQPPEGPTYLEGITYRLEYRPADPANLAAPWVVISEHIDDEAVVIKHLEPMGVYQFRVTARNGVGLGIPSLSSRMVQTHGRGVPKLQVDILKDHYRLNVVTLPQKSARQLNEISEESESEHGGDGQQSEEIIELSTKEPSERFQIDALLCRGKFSVLRAAIDGKTEGSAQCVVKIRDSKDADSKREFNLLKESQHENVQRLVAGHDCNGFLYLFCERLYEDVFSRFAFNDYYTEEQVAMTVRQLTSAIHYLHFRGIAHLDINPYNVMFQTKRNWIVKLVDFHSAQELSSAVKPTDINVLWAAPEMHVPEAPVTVQSDVWGMAAITFCLLGGFHPFYSEYDKPEDIKENVLNTKCDPNLIPVTASQEVLSFVTWGLKKSPIRRMRTDEALSHKFLSADPSMVRRREASKYSASRLRKTISLTLPQPARPISNELNNKYGEKNIQ